MSREETGGPDEEERKNPYFNYAKYSGLAIQMFSLIGIGIYGGIKLDEWLHLKFPAFTLALTIFSLTSAIYLAVKDFIKK